VVRHEALASTCSRRTMLGVAEADLDALESSDHIHSAL
jgi:hypothetical protein